MPSKPFIASVYEVESTDVPRLNTFSDTIETVMSQKTLDDKEQNIAGKWRRVDDADIRSGAYLLNFVTFEYSGPGRGRLGQPRRRISLDVDESFISDTTMLYDPLTNLVFLETTRSGMSSGAIGTYFKQYAPIGTSYTLVPVVDHDIAARVRRFETVRGIKMRVRLGAASSSDREAGISPIQGFGKEFGAEYIDLELKAGRARRDTLDLLGVRRIIELVGNASTEKMVVTGKEERNGRSIPIDMLQHRERRQVDLQIDPSTRRVPHDTRWDALEEMHYEYIMEV